MKLQKKRAYFFAAAMEKDPDKRAKKYADAFRDDAQAQDEFVEAMGEILQSSVWRQEERPG